MRPSERPPRTRRVRGILDRSGAPGRLRVTLPTARKVAARHPSNRLVADDGRGEQRLDDRHDRPFSPAHTHSLTFTSPTNSY